MDNNQASKSAPCLTHEPACNHCRSKKIRCDRMLPRCGNCRRACVACLYRSSGNPFNESRKSSKSRAANSLVDRLSLLESSLESLTGVVNDSLVGEPRNATTLLPSVLHQSVPSVSSETDVTRHIEQDCNGIVVNLQDGQRFLYGLYSNLAQCVELLRALVRIKNSRTTQSPILEHRVEQVSRICSLMLPQLFRVGTEHGHLNQPPQLAVTRAVEEFFTRKIYLRHLFHPSVLRSQIRIYYLGTLRASEKAMEFCLQYLLLMTGTAGEASSHSQLDQISYKLFLAAARAAVAEGHLKANRIVNVQALASISLIAFSCEDLLLADEAFHQCCSIIKRIGLHQENFCDREPFEQFEERQLLFWTLFVLDKSISFVLGRPYLLPSFDCSTQRPAVAFNSVLVDLISAEIELAIIQERIYRTLLASNNAQDDPGRQGEIDILINELNSWKDNYATSTEESDHSVFSPPDTIIYRVRLYKYHTMMAIILAESITPRVREGVLLNAREALNQVGAPGHHPYLNKLNWSVGYQSLIPFFFVIRGVLAGRDIQQQVADLQLLRRTIDGWEFGRSNSTSTLIIKLAIAAVESTFPSGARNAAMDFGDAIPPQNIFHQPSGWLSTASNQPTNEVRFSKPSIDGDLLEACEQINAGGMLPFGWMPGDIEHNTVLSNFPGTNTDQSLMQSDPAMEFLE